MIQQKSIKFSKLINITLALYILSLYLFTYREGLNNISNGIAVLLMAFIWVDILVNKKNVKFNMFIMLYSIFIFVSLFSTVFATDANIAFSKNITLLLLFALMLSLVNYIDSFEKLLVIIKSFAFSGVAASIYILVTSDLSNIQRFGDQLGNVNAIGLIISISTIFLTYFYGKNGRKITNVFYLFLIAFNSVFVILTGSRKSIIFLIAGIILVISGKTKLKVASIIKGIIVASIVIIFITYLVMNIPVFYDILGKRLENMLQGIFGSGTTEGSFNERVRMIEVGMQLFKQKPITGYGADNYRIISGFNTYSHNNFIELLVNIGFFGTIFFYVSYFYIIYKLFKYRKINLSLSFTLIAIVLGYILLGYGLVHYDGKHISIIAAITSAFPNILKQKHHKVVSNKNKTFNSLVK